MNVEDKSIRQARLGFFDLLEKANELIKSRYWLFVGITTVGYLIGYLVPLYILLGPMMCGIYYAYRRLEKQESVEFSDLFRGFDWFVPSLLVALAFLGTMIAVMIPLMGIWIVGAVWIEESSMGPDESPAVFLSVMLGSYALMLVLIWVISAIFLYAFPLMADRGLSASEAMSGSWRGFWNNPWGTMKTALLCGILMLLGTLCCYVGLFFLLPHVFGVIWLAYREVFEPVGVEDLPGDPLGT